MYGCRYCIAMPNLFHGRDMRALTVFDLKGSNRNRSADITLISHNIHITHLVLSVRMY